MKYLTFLMLMFVFLGESNAADVTASASRTSGVAPLSVHFNADLNRSTSTTRTFHNYKYVWDFDDTGDDPWGTDGTSRNAAYGAVAAHVFETAGTYNVTLTVYNSANGSVVTSLGESYTIKVTDPNDVYGGYKTTCISTNTDFTGCPAGAKHVTSRNLEADLPQYLGNGERTLLRRGDTWTINDRIDVTSAGVTLGAYGKCNGENSYGICTNAPKVIATSPPSAYTSIFSSTNKVDWRLMDISFSALDFDFHLVSGNTGMKNFLINRVKTEGFYMVVNLGIHRYNNTDYQTGMHINSSYFSHADVNFIYNGAERFAATGNYMDRCNKEHVLRTGQGYLNVIEHNRLSGQGYGKHALKLHGPSEDEVGDYATSGSGGARNRSEFLVVSDNVLGGSGVYVASVGPQNAQEKEKITDVLFERNEILSTYGYRAPTAEQGVEVAASYVTLRNNIFDSSGLQHSYRNIVINKKGVAPTPAYNEVYNNTMYSRNSGSYSRYGIVIGTASGTTVRNNYISFPGTTGTKILISGKSTNSNNVMTDTAGFVDPDNNSVLNRNFSITSSALAIDKGYTTPLLDSFNLNPRSGKYDAGAYEYGSGSGPTPPLTDSASGTAIPAAPRSFVLDTIKE